MFLYALCASLHLHTRCTPRLGESDIGSSLSEGKKGKREGVEPPQTGSFSFILGCNGMFLNTLDNVCAPIQFADGASRRFRQISEQKCAGHIMGHRSLSPAVVQCMMLMHTSSSRSVSTPRRRRPVGSGVTPGTTACV